MRIIRALARRVRNAIRTQIRFLRIDARFRRAMRAGRRPSHGLGAPLIVTLTSYPPRFPRLHYNLKSLLDQASPADKVILWVAERDMALVPATVRRLVKFGLEIRPAPDVRSFKKLVFAIRDFPEAFLVTADDDVVYRHDWLADLIGGMDIRDPTIVCRRAHRVGRQGDGFAPYLDWEFNVTDDRSTRPSIDLLPVGIGGVLYPPRALHPQVTDAEAFTRLCPHGDDLWFWWMGRRMGTRVVRVPEGDFPEELPGTQAVALTHGNWAGGNDRQLASLVREFGIAEVGLDGDPPPARPM